LKFKRVFLVRLSSGGKGVEYEWKWVGVVRKYVHTIAATGSPARSYYTNNAAWSGAN